MKRKVKKISYFWVEGDEGSGDKWFLGSNSKRLIRFLKENDPILCGVEKMTKKQFDRLPKI